MNTLYINIIGEDIQSTENITVVGKARNAIINEFYSELVNGIVERVNHPNIDDEKKRSLVTDFEAKNKEAFAKITEQWEAVKKVLFGEKPVGTCNVILPKEYVAWLYNHHKDVYNKIAICLAQRNNTVEISIEAIYKEAIGFLNNIDLSKQYDRFVVNDEAVKEKSQISVDIRKKIGEDVPFVEFEKWKAGIEDDSEKCPICEKNPCECICSQNSIKKGIFYAKKFPYDKNGCYRYLDWYCFFDSEGQRLFDDDFYLVARGEDMSWIDHTMHHLLVMKTKGDHSVYYLSSNGVLHWLGDYELEDGYRIGMDYSEKSWWKCTTEVIQDRYVLYRWYRHYKLFEIVENEIKLISEFDSKEILWWNCRVFSQYIAGEYCTIDLSTGKTIKIDGWQSPRLIGFNNNEPVFLASQEREWSYPQSTAITIQGEALWKFKFRNERMTSLPNVLIVVNAEGKEGILDLSGKLLVPCKCEDYIEQRDNDVFEIDDKYYILSKNLIADYYDGMRYGIFSNKVFRLYSMKDEQVLYEESMKKNHFSLEGGNFIVTENGDLFSLKANKVVYERIGYEMWNCSDNVFCTVNNGFVDVYDYEGKPIKTIYNDQIHNVRFIEDCFVFDNMQGECGYLDQGWNLHMISNKAMSSCSGLHISKVEGEYGDVYLVS